MTFYFKRKLWESRAIFYLCFLKAFSGLRVSIPDFINLNAFKTKIYFLYLSAIFFFILLAFFLKKYFFIDYKAYVINFKAYFSIRTSAYFLIKVNTLNLRFLAQNLCALPNNFNSLREIKFTSFHLLTALMTSSFGEML